MKSLEKLEFKIAYQLAKQENDPITFDIDFINEEFNKIINKLIESYKHDIIQEADVRVALKKKSTRLKRLAALIALSLAKKKDDPLYKKVKALRKKWLLYRTKLLKKYPIARTIALQKLNQGS